MTAQKKGIRSCTSLILVDKKYSVVVTLCWKAKVPCLFFICPMTHTIVRPYYLQQWMSKKSLKRPGSARYASVDVQPINGFAVCSGFIAFGSTLDLESIERMWWSKFITE